MRKKGIVDGGDAKTQGIGAMSDQRWAQVFQFASAAGVYPKAMNYKAGYTLQFLGARP
jgi:NitT/TauT family transport system substrate-binding protein